MQNTHQIYLILAYSGRTLAQSAFLADIPVVVVDLFGDQDTRRYAKQVLTLREFSEETILPLIENLWWQYDFAGLVIGSGFESRTALIRVLEDRWPVYGNSADTIRKAKDPFYLTDLFHHLKLSYPLVQTKALPGGQWLVKKTGGSGGDHVHWYQGQWETRSGIYFQAYQSGEEGSVLFLADSENDNATIIGYNRSWTENEKSFRFGGAVTLDEIPISAEIDRAVRAITKLLGLKGMCGIDFIVDSEGRLHFLEINPRPPGTFDLHEKKGSSLFPAHLDACQGNFSEITLSKEVFIAKSIVYARKQWNYKDLDWPEWAADIPDEKQSVQQGEPLCTVYARGADADTAVKLVHNRHLEIEAELFQF